MVLVAAALLTAAAIAAPYVSRWIAKKTLDEETEKLLEKKEVKQTIRKAEEKIREKSPSWGINVPFTDKEPEIEVTTYDIPGSQFYYRKKTSKVIAEELKKQGYSKRDIERITKGYERMELGEGIGEAAGTLALSAGAEKIGSAVAKPLIRSIGTSAGKRIAAVTIGSAVGGAYEGAMQTQVSSIAKTGQLANVSTTLKGAAFGAGTAAIGGATLSGLHELAVARPNFGTKFLYHAADLGGQTYVDPYEKPGDWLAAAIGRSTAKKGVSTVTPSAAISSFASSTTFTSSTSPTSTRSGTISFTGTPSSSEAGIGSPIPSSSTSPTSTSSTSQTPSVTPVPAPEPEPHSPAPEPEPDDDTPPKTPEPEPEPDDDTPPKTPEPEPEPQPETGTTTMSSIPTPMKRNPMPLPLPFIPSQIRAAPTTYARRGNLRYYNELEYSKQVLRKLLW